MQKMLRDVSWFIVVGCAAAATHWLIAVASVAVLNFAPLLANLVGWMVAFFVSFSGHYQLTFRHQPKKTAGFSRSLFPRFGRRFPDQRTGLRLSVANHDDPVRSPAGRDSRRDRRVDLHRQPPVGFSAQTGSFLITSGVSCHKLCLALLPTVGSSLSQGKSAVPPDLLHNHKLPD